MIPKYDGWTANDFITHSQVGEIDTILLYETMINSGLFTEDECNDLREFIADEKNHRNALMRMEQMRDGVQAAAS